MNETLTINAEIVDCCFVSLCFSLLSFSVNIHFLKICDITTNCLIMATVLKNHGEGMF